MAASRSTRVTRSTVGLNGLDESFCGRTLRNRSIAHPEEISSNSQVRSRSPKKRPEPVPIQKGNNNGRTTDLKQQSTRESWVSPRKRGLSSSEKDNIERQAIENCERRQTEPVSPVLKRIKRCLRSEAPNSSEEDSPIKSDKESVEQRSTVVDNDADFQGTKRACRCLILDDCEKREIKKVNVSEEGPLNSAVVEEITGYLDDESIPIIYRNLPEYKELLQFKKLKKQKLQQMQAESGFVQHVGFKCDNCGIEPIQGVRWHCQDCPPEMSLDFCDSCSDCLHETDIHKEDHQLEPIYRSETFLDRDYCVSQGTSYNYLDPNYFPANR
uniref:Zinc finger ZZ-type containing 3 n=1 Tax=Nomascus leucogenys TaxID=61853 RepID=A0A2I3H497_NOMLE